MSNDTVVSLGAPARVSDPLTELLRTGARGLVEAAVSAEFEEYLSAFVQEKLPDGRQRVVRNGHLPERKILTGLGEVDVRVPKARSRSGSPEPFRSSVAPPYVRRCASLDAAIPWLYLYGVSTGQMRQAVAALVGEQAARGLSANVVSRLKRSWDEEYRQWCRRRLDDDWVYLWADGIYSGLRGDHERLCVLVVIGVNARGEKHYCTTTRRGRSRLGRKPIAKRVNRTLARIDEVLRKRWHHDIWEVGRWLGRVCEGWLNYFAVPGSSRFIRTFLRRLQRLWMRALRRRSQRARFGWRRLERMTEILWPRASLRYPWPDQRFTVNHPR